MMPSLQKAFGAGRRRLHQGGFVFMPAGLGLNGAPAGPAGQTAWNPADKDAGITLSNSNRRATGSGGSAGHGVRGVSGKSSGKWYIELRLITISSEYFLGVATSGATLSTISNVYSIGGNYLVRSSDGSYFRSGALVASGGGSGVNNDYIGISLDFTTNTARAYRNGTLQATDTGLSAGTYFPYFNTFNSAAVVDVLANPVYLPSGFSVWE